MTLDLPRLAQGLPWLFIDFTRPGVRISHSKQENRPYLSAESIFGAGEGTLTPGLVLGKDAL